MKRVFIFLILLLGVLFELIPYDGSNLRGFILSDVTLPFKTHLYFLLEHFVLIMLSYIIYAESVKYRKTTFAFFLIQIFDLFDYFITYNSKWIGIISFNVISMIILGIVILIEFENERD
jgi:hypothetical protein